MEQLSGSCDADASVLNWNLLQTVSIIFCSLISVKLLCNLIFLVSIPSFCVGYINYSDIVESDIDSFNEYLKQFDGDQQHQLKEMRRKCMRRVSQLLSYLFIFFT